MTWGFPEIRRTALVSPATVKGFGINTCRFHKGLPLNVVRFTGRCQGFYCFARVVGSNAGQQLAHLVFIELNEVTAIHYPAASVLDRWPGRRSPGAPGEGGTATLL
jgi:hypothetical protein